MNRAIAAVYEYTSGTSELNIPFEYLRRAFVIVKLSGGTKQQLVLNQDYDYKFVSKNTIKITREYNENERYTTIIIERHTDATRRIINFQDGSILNASELNISQIQALHVAQEARGASDSVLSENVEGNLDANGRKIINLGMSKPYNDTEAVNVKAVKEMIKDTIVPPELTLNTFKLEGSAGIQHIAHRGASKAAPENTLPAYRLAGELGFWGAECDVQLTSDGHWVLMHDNTVDRTTDGSGAVKDLTLEYINSLDAGSKFGDYYSKTKVPTLDEYLDVCKQYKLVPVVEIKRDSNTTSEKLRELLDKCLRFFPDYSFVIISFDLGLLKEVRTFDVRTRLQHVCSEYYGSLLPDYLANNIDIDVGVGGLYEDMSFLTKQGLKLNCWTINAVKDYYKAVKAGVNQITTDFITF